MGIERVFTETAEIYSKTITKEGGVNVESLVLVDTIKCGIDKSTTTYAFTSNKETFIYSDVLYCALNDNVKEGDSMVINTLTYDIISVIDPMKRAHHLEVLLNRRD